MKAVVLSCLAMALFPWGPQARAQIVSDNQYQPCFKSWKVTSVGQGYVEPHPDGGDAIKFTLENGRVYFINGSYNLDFERGKAMKLMLDVAMQGGYRITGYDHSTWSNSNHWCTFIDQIILEK